MALTNKVIHSYWDCFNKIEKEGLTSFDFLCWVLSVLKYKKYGYITKLYCDKKTEGVFKSYGLLDLYDEVDVELLEKDHNILKTSFWAMPKILSYKNELELGENPLISDTDVIPFCDFECYHSPDLLIWSRDEHLEYKHVYPDKADISTAWGYAYPKWFTWRAQPLNTGVIYFNNKQTALEYCNHVIDYVKNNKNNKNNNLSQTMCFAEQRMIGEFAKYKCLNTKAIKPFNASCLTMNAWHLYKAKLLKKKDYFEILMLHMIKEEFKDVYDKISSLPLLKDINDQYVQLGHIDAQNRVNFYRGVR